MLENHLRGGSVHARKLAISVCARHVSRRHIRKLIVVKELDMRSILITLVLLGGAVMGGAGQSLKISESIESLERKARSDSNDAAAQFNLALGYWSKKRYDDAVTPLRKAVAIDPEFAAAYSLFIAIAPSRFASQVADARQRLATLP